MQEPSAITENVENLILEHMRAMRAVLSRHDGKFDLLIGRVGSLEQSVASLHVDIAMVHQKV